jgi:hypothetical protein
MGVLIYLPERPESSQSDASARTQNAEILFFTGVRYERHKEEDQSDRTTRPARRNLGDAPRPRRRRG